MMITRAQLVKLIRERIEEFVDGSYGMRGRTVPMGAIINEEPIEEIAPPGMEDFVKSLKGKVDNPYAVAWASYNKKNKK